MTQVKQDFSDLITSAPENVSSVTISSVLPDTTGTRDDRIKEINNFLKDKCSDTGARFVDNDNNFLFRDGSCDTSAFQDGGVRLSTCGVKRLMSNLSLAASNLSLAASNLSLAASNLSLAASKHREDGAQRGSSPLKITPQSGLRRKTVSRLVIRYYRSQPFSAPGGW